MEATFLKEYLIPILFPQTDTLQPPSSLPSSSQIEPIQSSSQTQDPFPSQIKKQFDKGKQEEQDKFAKNSVNFNSSVQTNNESDFGIQPVKLEMKSYFDKQDHSTDININTFSRSMYDQKFEGISFDQLKGTHTGINDQDITGIPLHPIGLIIPEISYVTQLDATTVKLSKYSQTTIAINPRIDAGIVQCEIVFRGMEVLKAFSCGVGVIDADYDIPHPYNPGKDDKSAMFQSNTGHIIQLQRDLVGNQPYRDEQVVCLEVNMDEDEHELRMFIDGVEQPVYLRGLPDHIRFFGFLWGSNKQFSVVSLRQVSQSKALGKSNQTRAEDWLLGNAE
ncbi:MAG: hypothetical protein EZS28_032063 [Streblomastix strix]|uniref:SPRY domain-containing protein n=1 Tax=Streblomastix strix TaxID=222440 RepID=A0A5J4UQN5_9EUKA|nr:MAG: hypothetical protein EZS28_032063 [Streblomastix strix]